VESDNDVGQAVNHGSSHTARQDTKRELYFTINAWSIEHIHRTCAFPLSDVFLQMLAWDGLRTTGTFPELALAIALGE